MFFGCTFSALLDAAELCGGQIYLLFIIFHFLKKIKNEEN
jgi:hypothetical protein